MILYSYYCEKCKLKIDKWFEMGKAAKRVKCEKCGNKSDRTFGVNVSVPDPVSDARINRGSG